MERSDQQKKPDKHPPAKRPYARPRLTDYGDLRVRTLNRGNFGHADGGVHPNNKTGT